MLSSLTRADGEHKVLVLKYGSDPLKTYLPDSDIDITVVPLVQDPDNSKDLATMPAVVQLRV